jgi:hypothetical protein
MVGTLRQHGKFQVTMIDRLLLSYIIRPCFISTIPPTIPPFKATKDTFCMLTSEAFVALRHVRVGAAGQIESEVAQISALLSIPPSSRYGRSHD